MKNLTIHNELNQDGDYILIKTLTNFNDFKDGIRVFTKEPYNEILTDKDCMEEYSSYINNGIVFACYVNNNLAGINCILNDVPTDYSIAFHNKDRVAYYSGLAVKEQFRKRGLGKLLVHNTQKYLEQQQEYDYCFARILCQGSMSEGIFKQNGFIDAYVNDQLIVDDVTYERNRSDISFTDRRKYMVKTLNKNAPSWYKNT